MNLVLFAVFRGEYSGVRVWMGTFPPSPQSEGRVAGFELSYMNIQLTSAEVYLKGSDTQEKGWRDTLVKNTSRGGTWVSTKTDQAEPITV
eukprot:COSAG02_NODE_12903_length_1474_cov_1.654545_1_plen_90_part_00